MSSPRGIACWLGHSAPGWLRPLLSRHRGACSACRELAEALHRVDDGLRALAAVAPAPPPFHLRDRVLDAVERDRRVLRARASRGPRLLARATIAAGAIATAALVLAVAESRLDAWRTPPRTVQMILPPGTRAVGDPVLVIRRASGQEERR